MPLDPLWAGIARQVPDSRPRHATGERRHRILGHMEPVYCLNCGADGGYVTAAWARFIAYLCDTCTATHGSLPTPEIPEALVRGLASS